MLKIETLHEKSWKSDRSRLQDLAEHFQTPVPSGPWDDEPDKIQWIDPVSNLDCLIVRNHAGGLCGYVGLPPEHPLYGKSPLSDEDFPEGIVVHGGLNFGNKCGGEICHVPEPGRPHDVWWLGFDCGHCWDMQPQDIILGIVIGRAPVDDPYRGTYRDVDYVKAQVFLLATQLAVLA